MSKLTGMSLHLPHRPRRNRKSAAIRDLVRETELTPGHLIYPLFIQEGRKNDNIASMPGCKRWCLESLVKEAGEAHALGIPAVVLFPKVADKLKTSSAEECYNPGGLGATRDPGAEAILSLADRHHGRGARSLQQRWA